MSQTLPTLTVTKKNPFAYGMMMRVFPALVSQIEISGIAVSARPHLTAFRKTLTPRGIVPSPSSTVGMAPRSLWRAARSLIGSRWYGLPSYEAEVLFYHLLLDTIGYFDARAPLFGFDIFGEKKLADLDMALSTFTAASRDRPLKQRILDSLWGNLGDRAHKEFAQTSGQSHAVVRSPLLVDEIDAAADALSSAQSVGIVADNAGSELLADLLLARDLLCHSQAKTVTLYLKQRPFYISDATFTDFQITLSRILGSSIGDTLASSLAAGRLRIATHPFFHAPLHYHALPQSLRNEFQSHDLVIMKGDLNYRRLLSDRLVPPTTPLEAVAVKIGVDLVILRTMKSDICAGLTAEIVDELQESESDWRFAGRYAVIHFLGAK